MTQTRADKTVGMLSMMMKHYIFLHLVHSDYPPAKISTKCLEECKMNPAWLFLIAPFFFLIGSWCRGLKAAEEMRNRNKDLENIMRFLTEEKSNANTP